MPRSSAGTGTGREPLRAGRGRARRGRSAPRRPPARPARRARAGRPRGRPARRSRSARRPVRGADRRREVRAQPGQALQRHAVPRSRPPRGAGQRGPERGRRLQLRRAGSRRRARTCPATAGAAASRARRRRSRARRARPSATTRRPAGPARDRPRTSRARAAPPPARARRARRSPAAPSPARPGGAPSAPAPTAAGRPGDAVATSASSAVTIVAVLPSIMSVLSNAIAPEPVTQKVSENARRALLWGFVGVLAFSFSLPATRLAVEDLNATFVGLGRALVAAALAALLLAWRRERVPDRRDLPRFALVGLGVVVGFPIFTSLALQHTSSAHASVVVGLLPAATAAWAVARAGERPPRRVLARGRRGPGRGARLRRDPGRRRHRERRPAGAGRGRSRRARVRRRRRAVAPVRRLAGDLLGAHPQRAVPRHPGDARDRRLRPARRHRRPGWASPTSR